MKSFATLHLLLFLLHSLQPGSAFPRRRGRLRPGDDDKDFNKGAKHAPQHERSHHDTGESSSSCTAQIEQLQKDHINVFVVLRYKLERLVDSLFSVLVEHIDQDDKVKLAPLVDTGTNKKTRDALAARLDAIYECVSDIWKGEQLDESSRSYTEDYVSLEQSLFTPLASCFARSSRLYTLQAGRERESGRTADGGRVEGTADDAESNDEDSDGTSNSLEAEEEGEWTSSDDLIDKDVATSYDRSAHSAESMEAEFASSATATE